MNESKKSIIIIIIAIVVLAGLIYLVQRQRAEKSKPKETPKLSSAPEGATVAGTEEKSQEAPKKPSRALW